MSGTSKLVIKHLIRMIKITGVKFDTIVFMGISGSLVAPIVAQKMNKHLLVARKLGENNHSCMRLEGHIDSHKFIIIDDLISTGDTIKAIFEAIDESVKKSPGNLSVDNCQGIFLYNGYKEFGNRHITLNSGKTISVPYYSLCMEGDPLGLTYFMGKEIKDL